MDNTPVTLPSGKTGWVKNNEAIKNAAEKEPTTAFQSFRNGMLQKGFGEDQIASAWQAKVGKSLQTPEASAARTAANETARLNAKVTTFKRLFPNATDKEIRAMFINDPYGMLNMGQPKAPIDLSSVGGFDLNK